MYSHAVAHIVAVRVVVCRAPFVPYDVLAEMPFLHSDRYCGFWPQFFSKLGFKNLYRFTPSLSIIPLSPLSQNPPSRLLVS